jgi:hypothetical protein
MIQSLTKASDLSKYCLTNSLKLELEKILDQKDYVEIVSGSRLLISLKPKNGVEILFVEDEDDYVFLKNIRDNYEEIKNLAKHKNLLDKITKNKIDENHFFASKVKRCKIKKQSQLSNLFKKIDIIKDRLQNVFIIHSDFQSLMKTFDQNKCIFIFSDFSPEIVDALKKVRYSEVLLFFYNCSIPYKKLKELDFKNLSSNKESSKYIWYKSNK